MQLWFLKIRNDPAMKNILKRCLRKILCGLGALAHTRKQRLPREDTKMALSENTFYACNKKQKFE